MKPHLPPHSFRPGEVLLFNGVEGIHPSGDPIIIKIFASTDHGYDFFVLAPEGVNPETLYDSRNLILSDAFLSWGWDIFEVSGKMSRETPGELERRNCMIADERRKLLAAAGDRRAILEQRYGKHLDEILRMQPPPNKHFSAPPLQALPYVPAVSPEHLPKLHVTA